MEDLGRYTLAHFILMTQPLRLEAVKNIYYCFQYPFLAYQHCDQSTVRSWNVGPFSALAVAKVSFGKTFLVTVVYSCLKVWSGAARLPNNRRLWEEHRHLALAAGGIASPQLEGIGFGAPITECKPSFHYLLPLFILHNQRFGQSFFGNLLGG